MSENPVRSRLRQLDAAFMQDPHSLYAELHRDGPAHRVVLPPDLPVCGGLPVWVVTGHATVRAALADPRLSTDLRRTDPLFAQNAPDSDKRGAFSASLATHMLHSDPPDHTRLRRLVNSVFTTRAVERLRPAIERLTHHLLDGLDGEDVVDLLDRFAFPLPIAVICLLLGIPAGEEAVFSAWSRALVAGGTSEAAATASAELTGYLRDLIERKRHAPSDDVLSMLVAARDDEDRLSETELLSMTFLLLVAGHETTVNTLGNGVFHLMADRDQWEKLLADRSLLPTAVEEFLRIEGPLKHATFRCATQGVRIGDVDIPAGDFVLLSLASANRDPRRFPRPHDLDVSRADGGHLAFGHGIHHCLGAPLARLEARIAFDALLQRFPGMELAVPPGELRWRSSTLIRGLRTLPVRLHRA
ncbi:cytochrome P450 family protein [Streptomyces lydicus]|uniref:Cytochrome n=1 Tax=Streptomyces lydicus TaxID=47763 RepID=A0A1D7VJP9_9ACTN|nr:cytochrome P450 [Streptomyces lydicus]AOP46966.1 cytochrome [Streptomyces lydicus]